MMTRHGPSRALLLLTLVAIASFGLAVPAEAEPGDLDGAVGGCGFVTTSYRDTPANPGAERTDRLIPSTSGRVVQTFVNANAFITMVRYTRTGLIDPTFGNNGTVVSDLRAGPTLEPVRFAYGGLDGRIYLIGVSPSSLVTVEAFGSGGALDPSFDDDGRRELPATQLASAAVQPDGRLLIAYFNEATTLHRLQLDGSDDTTFVLGGDPFFDANAPIFAATDPWGRIFVVRGDINNDAKIHRYLPDGSIDLTFTFEATVPVGSRQEYRVTDLQPQANGTVYLLERRAYQDDGVSAVYHGAAWVARFGNGGALDHSFGDGGWILVRDDRITLPSELAVRADGAIVVTGLNEGQLGDSPRVFVRQRTAAGAPPAGWTDREILVTDEPSASPAQHGLAIVGSTAYVAASAAGRIGFTSVAAVRLDALRRGAGLMLQWNGDAWPTRFGSDPGPECTDTTPYWPDDDLARGITTVNGKGGYVVDAYGGIHRFSFGLQHPRPPKAIGGPYWLGWDVTRGIASKADGTGGYVLDAYGGAHPFHTGTNPNPAPTVNGPYWPGWNITRGIALLPDGNRGYILDGFGGIHPFTTSGHAMPPALNHTAYWNGWDIARGIAVLPDGTGGYIGDAFGGAHPFGVGTNTPPPVPGAGAPYAAGEDWVRGFAFVAPMPASSGVGATSTRPSAAGATKASLTDRAARARTPHRPVTRVR